ncbi:MAG: phospho-N-acetylmuramoyl-pentapeptide-transferase [Clostridia bacterium]|nr:phospho-N-acetylmuramoyl-pentapeptide-transferase [Clostridia bacterium]
MNMPWAIYLFVFILSFAICAPTCKAIIPRLRRSAAQPIYEGGPTWHTSKSGTPTLGGISFIIAITVSGELGALLLVNGGKTEEAISVVSILAFALVNSLIGLADDITKLTKKQNAGLTPLQKLFLQSVSSVAFLALRRILFGDDTAITVAGYTLELGAFYYFAAFVFLLGIINCANLTDGVDGLAAGVSFSSAIPLFLISAHIYSDCAMISAALAGGALAFLLYNSNPAKIFMGDTGSLYLGAVAASLPFTLDNPFLSFLFGTVYVIEGLSVIIQVISYKTRKKRVFIMAPLHHHLEKRGWGETKICLAASALTLLATTPLCFLI